jgi:hypothetical protein
MSADAGSPRIDTSGLSRRTGLSRLIQDPATVLLVSQAREVLVEGSMKR